jgi:predicted KAP-like P-loop ATPase
MKQTVAELILAKHLKSIDDSMAKVRDEIQQLNAEVLQKQREQEVLYNNRNEVVEALKKLEESYCPVVQKKKGKK